MKQKLYLKPRQFYSSMSDDENLPAQCHPVFETKKKKKRLGGK